MKILTLEEAAALVREPVAKIKQAIRNKKLAGTPSKQGSRRGATTEDALRIWVEKGSPID